MGTAALISVEEYLATSYRPNCDYVDGQLIGRNPGAKDHRKLQHRVIMWFENRHREFEGILRTTDGRVVLPIADLFRPDEI